MVIPIAATPVLKGKEAQRFWKEELQNRSKFVSKKEIKKVVSSFIKFCRIV